MSGCGLLSAWLHSKRTSEKFPAHEGVIATATKVQCMSGVSEQRNQIDQPVSARVTLTGNNSKQMLRAAASSAPSKVIMILAHTPARRQRTKRLRQVVCGPIVQ